MWRWTWDCRPSLRDKQKVSFCLSHDQRQVWLISATGLKILAKKNQKEVQRYTGDANMLWVIFRCRKKKSIIPPNCYGSRFPTGAQVKELLTFEEKQQQIVELTTGTGWNQQKSGFPWSSKLVISPTKLRSHPTKIWILTSYEPRRKASET